MNDLSSQFPKLVRLPINIGGLKPSLESIFTPIGQEVCYFQGDLRLPATPEFIDAVAKIQNKKPSAWCAKLVSQTIEDKIVHNVYEVQFFSSVFPL